MLDFVNVTESGGRNIHLLRLLSIGDCYSRDTGLDNSGTIQSVFFLIFRFLKAKIH